MKLVTALLSTNGLKAFLKLCPLLFYRFNLVLVKNPCLADIKTTGYWEKLMNGESQESKTELSTLKHCKYSKFFN